MKRLGLISVLGLAMIAAPGAAFAAGWVGHGGGHYVAPARVAPAPVARGYAPARTYAPYRTYAPARPYVPYRTYAPPARVWVPGYWGVNHGARVWIGSSWTFPPYSGWLWVAPRWAWNGYQWVWQEGYWSPPIYAPPVY